MFVYESVIRALFDSGAVPNVMFAKLCSELHMKSKETFRKMRMADGLEAFVLGHEILIPVGTIACFLTFSVEKDTCLR